MPTTRDRAAAAKREHLSAQEQGFPPGAVLVTGAAAGIGRAIAARFAEAGRDVVLFDVDAAGLDQAAEGMAGTGGGPLAVAGSVSDEEDVKRVFAEAARRFGGIGVLVNNAGVSCNRPTLELSLEEWRQALDTNLTGAFLCAREAGRYMVPRHGGVILNISSMYGLVAAPDRLGYCASKSAVAMMTRALAVEWAREGVRVIGIAPGYIRTRLLEELIETGRVDEAALRERTPEGRLGEPEEVAELALFLASGRAAYMTGQVIGLDGGWTAYGYI